MSNGNTATEFSPVTESEMRGFFQRLADTIVHNTKTQEELDRVKAQLAELNDRVTTLVATNNQIRQELYTTVSERDAARKEAAENKDLAETYLRERDASRADHANTRDELRDVRTELFDRRRDLEQSKTSEAVLERDRDYWKSRAEAAEKLIDLATKRREQIEATMKKLFEADPEPEAKATEVAYTPSDPERFQPRAQAPFEAF